jgi:glycosyltransferase involved in cell wall biosynthesis
VSLVVHLSTLHPRFDTRIRLKEVRTLAQSLREQVVLMVADGLGSAPAAHSDSAVHDLGRLPKNRVARVLMGNWRALNALFRLRAAVLHIHDPELLPLGFVMRIFGVKVVYDVHEDFAKVAQSKRGLPRSIRALLTFGVRLVEWGASRSFSMVVVATPSIARRFPGDSTVLVQNFPLLEELRAPRPTPFQLRRPAVAFVGYISRERAALEMVGALGLLEHSTARLELAGEFSPPGLFDEIRTASGWDRVTFHGFVGRNEIAQLLGRVRAGVVLFHALPNHVEAQPNKMFEYMSAGLPVIASDFPLWRQMIQATGCGLLVDPKDPQAIADAVGWVIEHPEEAEEMGRRGRAAVEHTYNWDVEGARLVEAYRRVLGCQALADS